jgi:hypothetical protein
MNTLKENIRRNRSFEKEHQSSPVMLFRPLPQTRLHIEIVAAPCYLGFQLGGFREDSRKDSSNHHIDCIAISPNYDTGSLGHWSATKEIK